MEGRHRTLVVDATQLRTCRFEVITPTGMLVLTVDTESHAVEVSPGELPPETQVEGEDRRTSVPEAER